MGSGDSSLTREEVKEKIEKLQKEVKAIQSGKLPKHHYPRKLRELMYWRTRQTQLGKEE